MDSRKPARPSLASMGHRPKYFIENLIQPDADVFGEKSQHVVTVLLEHTVLLPITSIRITISEMLSAVEFDDQSILRIEKISFHPATPAKRN